jgi:glyoxylase-like metal-dependent hydrolase (beta-lactamase superfamily II)
MKVERFIFGPFQTNTYVVSDEQHILLVDPACYTPYEQQQLYNYINRQSIVNCQSSNRQLSIVATHGHLDHLWGAKWATETWHTPVLMHEADIPMARAMQQQYDLFGIRATAEAFPMEGIQSTDRFTDRIQTDLQIIETPGHTPGSICLYFPQSPITNHQSPILLSGDTLFQMGYGRTDLPGGNMGQLIDSLEKLFTLPSDVLVYPGHGDFTTIGAEKR